MATLKVTGASKAYAGRSALAPVDLTVEDGEFCSLLGPSGSGKSTLLRIIAGLTLPDQGRVELGGRDISNLDASKRNIGFVFQSYALFPHMSVGSNVAFGLHKSHLSRAGVRDAVREVLELVGLDHLASRRPAQLSGGQQQRVALARALVTKPDILLLDEPLSALDRKIRGDLQRELKRLHLETGMTTIMVTHDQDEATGLSTNIVMLDQGEVQQNGTPRQLIESPANKFVADFLGAERLGAGEVVSDDAGRAINIGGVRLRHPAVGLDDGQRADVMVIAEEVVLGKPSGSHDELAGIVDRIEISGRMARIEVRIGNLMVPAVMPAREAFRFTESAPVSVMIDPRHLHVFAQARAHCDRGAA
jgi:ABC-type Fe3+/spermidine/putrescine transport system ATPase subunit